MGCRGVGRLRRRKPKRKTEPLKPRLRAELAASELPRARRPALLLDTNVDIAAAAGTLPDAAAAVVERALLFHSTLCLGELAIGVANADPTRPSWRDPKITTRHSSSPCPIRGSSSRTTKPWPSRCASHRVRRLCRSSRPGYLCAHVELRFRRIRVDERAGRRLAAAGGERARLGQSGRGALVPRAWPRRAGTRPWLTIA